MNIGNENEAFVAPPSFIFFFLKFYKRVYADK